MDVSASRPLLPDWASAAIVTLLTVAVGFLVWSLADQNRSLKNALATADRGGVAASSLADDDELPSAVLVGLDGATADLGDLGQTGGIAVSLTTTCPFCKESLPTIRSKVAWLRGSEEQELHARN